MALHVRSLKLNLLRLRHLRSLPYATQVDSNFYDKTSAESRCASLPATDLVSEEEFCAGKRIPVCPSASCDIKLGLGYSAVSPYSVKLCNRARDLAELAQPRKSCVRQQNETENFLNSVVTENSNYDTVLRFADMLKPLSCTSDDIIVCDGHGADKRPYSDIITRENHAVTVISVPYTPCIDNIRAVCQLRDVTFLNSCVTNYSGVPSDPADTSEKKLKTEPPPDGPGKEKLLQLKEFFEETLPRFFKDRLEYRIYHKDIILENNFWGENVIIRGINGYLMQMNKVRILSHLRFAYVRLNIMKITVHPEDGTVRIRWQIGGLSQFKSLQFWKFLPWKYRKSIHDETTYYDGFSILHVGSDGLIYKHRVDRVMPDEELQEAKATKLAFKLGLAGVAPKLAVTDFNGLFCQQDPRLAMK